MDLNSLSLYFVSLVLQRTSGCSCFILPCIFINLLVGFGIDVCRLVTITQISLKLLAIPQITFSELPQFQWCVRFAKFIYLMFQRTKKYEFQPLMSKMINITFVWVNNNVLKYFCFAFRHSDLFDSCSRWIRLCG